MPTLRHRPCAGFTLIEAIIAIAMSLAVILVVFSAIRVASQTFATAKRLHLENSLLRSGIRACYAELDFWTNYDDPALPSATDLQGLRRHRTQPVATSSFDFLGRVWEPGQIGDAFRQPYEGQVLGLPFAPFSASAPDLWTASGTLPEREAETGFDDVWNPADERTWYRGNLGQRPVSLPYYPSLDPDQGNGIDEQPNTGGDYREMWVMPGRDAQSRMAFGRYGLFTNLTDRPDTIGKAPFYTFGSGINRDGDSGVYGLGATPRGWHHWRDRQIDGLRRSLGMYGLLDYAPSNVVLAVVNGESIPKWYAIDHATSSRGRASPSPFIVPISMYTGFYSGATAPSLGWQPYANGYFETALAQDTMKWHWHHVGLTGNNFYWTYTSIYSSAYEMAVPLLRQRPADWPYVDTTISRTMADARTLNTCRVRWLNPQTGQVVQVAFTGFGTTLKGARQQRIHPRAVGRAGVVSGWAAWDNDRSGGVRVDHRADPAYWTLDSYPRP